MIRSSGRKNYALESLNLLVQHDFTLSPRQATELIWSRFVNTKGLKGTNIPNDLHMEHLNSLVKTSISGLGANKTVNSIMKVSKDLHVLSPVLNNFGTPNRSHTFFPNHPLHAHSTVAIKKCIMAHTKN